VRKRKTNDALEKALKEADAVFIAKIGKVDPLGQTNSIPRSTFGTAKFTDTKALRGKVLEAALYSYSFREGAKNINLKLDGQVLVAAKQLGLSVIVPASEANLALAKKVIEAK
jgi:hypothetical protein